MNNKIIIYFIDGTEKYINTNELYDLYPITLFRTSITYMPLISYNTIYIINDTVIKPDNINKCINKLSIIDNKIINTLNGIYYYITIFKNEFIETKNIYDIIDIYSINNKYKFNYFIKYSDTNKIIYDKLRHNKIISFKYFDNNKYHTIDIKNNNDNFLKSIQYNLTDKRYYHKLYIK
jgi:hypothetical protein